LARIIYPRVYSRVVASGGTQFRQRAIKDTDF
jgi:hypothetical protein